MSIADTGKVEVKDPASGNTAGGPTTDISATEGGYENIIVVSDGSDSDMSVGWKSASSVAPSAAQSTTLSSVDENSNASLSLFQAFYGDEDVDSHLTEAFTRIPPHTVKKNLSRLLLRLSRELKVEKPTSAETAARNFFKSEIPSLHQRLTGRYGPPEEEVYQRLHHQQSEPILMSRFIFNTDTDEARFVSDSKSENGGTNSSVDADDADIPGYEDMKNFLVGGQPFHNFKTRLAKFIHPSSGSTLQRAPTPEVIGPTFDDEPAPSHLRTDIPQHTPGIGGPSAGPEHAESGINNDRDERESDENDTKEPHLLLENPIRDGAAFQNPEKEPMRWTEQQSDPEQRPSLVEDALSEKSWNIVPSHISSWAQLFKSLTEMLACLWRPRIPSGHVRVSWNCRCGKRIYEDFGSANRAAAVEFAQQAAGPLNSQTVSLSESGSHVSTRSSSDNRSSLSEDDTQGTPPSLLLSDGDEPLNRQIPPGTPRYLLLCVNSGMHRIGLANVDLTHCLEHDHILFLRIKEEYEKLRGTRAKNIFVIPRTIQYIKFELIHRHKSEDTLGNFERDSIPSKEEAGKAGYSFHPCPPDVGIYPVSPRVFMHSFREPGDHTGSLVFQRLPKKLWRELTCGNSQQNIPVGWGIYFIEGYNWKLIIRCVLGVLFPTLILAVLWCILKRDVQAGMGIGQYSVALVALALPLLVFEQSLDD